MQQIRNPSNIIVCGGDVSARNAIIEKIRLLYPDAVCHENFNPVTGSQILRNKDTINMFNLDHYNAIMPEIRNTVDVWVFAKPAELDLFIRSQFNVISAEARAQARILLKQNDPIFYTTTIQLFSV